LIAGLSTEQVFLDERKTEYTNNGICKGVYRKEKKRIPCTKKVNFVCRLTKAEWQENKVLGSSGQPEALGQEIDQFAALFNP